MDILNSTATPSLAALASTHFGMVEYFIFGALLSMSALIGVYFGCVRSQNTVSDYLLGGKKMGVLPVALSNVASHVSGITLLGVPAEVYLYGTQYYVIIVSLVVVTFLVITCYLPVFYGLQLNSAFQYLEMRFNSKVRRLGSFLFAALLIVYIPIVIYVPALAFNQVTGVSIHIIAPVICIVCIFYTTVGGLKAVIWTDALQSVFIAISVTSVIVIGTAELGGVKEVFRIADEGHRLELFNFNPDPLARNTFWTVLIGTHFFWLINFAVHPGSVQKFICVPTLRGAKSVMLISCVCMFAISSLTTFLGLLIYGKYHDCDPIATKMIRKSGQLLPLYVMDVARNYPGLAGLFISGVVSAALSTMSASLNTVAGTLYEDFVAPFYRSTKNDQCGSMIMKFIVLLIGSICVMLILVVERLDGIIQTATSLSGISSGAMIYIFSVGIFLPWVNAQGALWGAVAGLSSMVFIVGGSQYYILAGQLKFPAKLTSMDQCPLDIISQLNLNLTTLSLSNYISSGSPVVATDVPAVFQVSYMYFMGLGTVVGLMVGLVVSWWTGGQDLTVLKPELLSPCVRRFLPVAVPKEEQLRLMKSNNNVQIVITKSGEV